ncbi:GATA zinc finger domain-containing protein 4 isoform X2 [Hydra vulgaris]|uniref:GATA zinc finger domain-containing protein 4 isoform X2 n=1 Tax=Hydra vulgaris TaxID=6087 RepID=A0ABM4CX80_HYDVU
MAIELEKWVNKNKYWFALVTSLNYGGIDVCLRILHDDSLSTSLPRDPSLLFKSLRKHKGFFYNLLKHGVVSLTEYNLLYNSEEEVDSSVFDLGLIITLLQGIVLPEPIDGWLHPNSEDTSVSAFLVSLRKFKDKINEMKVTKLMSEVEFHDLWDELNEILHAFYFDTAILNDIFLTTTRETFYFTPPFDVKFASAFNRAKHFYLVKVINEVRELFDRHTENVTTVMSVVQNSKITKIYSEISRLKKGIANMYRLHEDFMYFQYKDASPLLSVCEQLNLSIGLNDDSLDKIIAEYNFNLESSKMLNKKQIVDQKNQMQPNSKPKHFTLPKTAAMSWFRRNTLTNPPTQENLTSAFQTENNDEKSSLDQSLFNKVNEKKLYNQEKNSSKGPSKESLANIFRVETDAKACTVESTHNTVQEKNSNNQENYKYNLNDLSKEDAAVKTNKSNCSPESASDSVNRKKLINNDKFKNISEKELSTFKTEINNLKSYPDKSINYDENTIHLNNLNTSTNILLKSEELRANFKNRNLKAKSFSTFGFNSDTNENSNIQDNYRKTVKTSNEAQAHAFKAEYFKSKSFSGLSTFNGVNEKNINIDHKTNSNNLFANKGSDTSFQTENTSLEESVKKDLMNQDNHKNNLDKRPKVPPKKDFYTFKSEKIITKSPPNKSEFNHSNERFLNMGGNGQNSLNSSSANNVNEISFRAESNDASSSLEKSANPNKKYLNNQNSYPDASKIPPKVPPKKEKPALDFNIEDNKVNNLKYLNNQHYIDITKSTKSDENCSLEKDINKNVLKTHTLFKTKTFMRDGIPQSMFYEGKIE